MVDLEYKELGLFTMFMPVSEDGLECYNNELHPMTEGTGKVLTIQLDEVLHALKKAGYKVREMAEAKFDADELYDSLTQE